MKRFSYWLVEKKKKSTKESMPTTATSSPLRGANQDQTGFNPKTNVADYTISDEYIQELIAGVGDVRTTPVDTKTTTLSKSANSPSSARSMQRAADSRRAQLDKVGQKEKEQQVKDRELEIQRRQKDANNRSQQ